MNQFDKIEIKISTCSDKLQVDKSRLAEKLQYMEYTRAIAEMRQEMKRSQNLK